MECEKYTYMKWIYIENVKKIDFICNENFVAGVFFGSNTIS